MGDQLCISTWRLRIRYFSKMSSKICLGLFLILTAGAVVLGSADDKSQDLDLSRVAREAENSNIKKNRNVNKRKKARKIKKGGKKTMKRNRNKTVKKNNKKGKKRGKKQKRSRKNKKKKSKKDKKGKRKNRKSKKKVRKAARRNNRQTSTVSANCYSQTVFIMNIWKNVVTNFKKQNA